MSKPQPHIFVWNNDNELSAWIVGIFEKHSGEFLRTIAEAAMRADWENYAILRPVLLALRDKYPEYAKQDERRPNVWPEWLPKL